MSDSVQKHIHRSGRTLQGTEDRLHIRLFTVDTLTLPAGHWNTQNVQSPFWRFYQNADEGAFITLKGGEPFYFAANHLYFVPSGVRFSCGNNVAFEHFYIHFDLMGLSRLTMRALFGGPVKLPEDISFSAQVALFAREVRRSSARDLSICCRAKSLVYEGLARCLVALPMEIQDRMQEEEENRAVIEPALLYIEDSVGEGLNIPALAALCCQSPDHFARRFKAIVGQTPNEYIREQRVRKAAQLLLFSGQSLEEIANSCGFGSRHYLTRVFTEIVGVSPGRYRKGEYRV